MNEDPSSSKKPWFKRLGFDKKKVALAKWNEDLGQLSSEGKVSESSVNMIRSIVFSQSLTVRDIMIPRAKMFSIAIDEPFESALEKIIESGHSRIPILSNDHEEFAGLLLTKDLLKMIKNPSLSIHSILRPIEYVPDGKYVTALLNEFRERHFHLALVVDEFGAVTGLVTIEDIIEQIVGEIDDEHDAVDECDVCEIEQVDENHYIIDAMMSLEEFNERFNSNFMNDEVETIGGLIMTQCGVLPKENEEFLIDGFTFKVLPYDGKVLSQLELKNISL